MTKVAILIITGLVLAGGGFYLYQSQASKTEPAPSATTQLFSHPSPTTVRTPAPKTGLANLSDTSNSALDKDFNDVQNNLNKLDNDQQTAKTDTSSQDYPPAQ